MSAPRSLLALGAAQRGIWNAQLLDPTSPYYVVGEVLELEGLTPGIDGTTPDALLAKAIHTTINEAETLRLRFIDTPTGPKQYVDSTAVALPKIRDLSGAPDPVLLATAIIDEEKTSCGERWRTMTDTELCRYVILDLGWTGTTPEKGRTLWCIQLYHHIIVDGYSAALLTRRIAAHYTACAGGRPARRHRFSTIAEVVNADLAYSATDKDDDRTFWRNYLSPAPDTTGREDLVHGSGTTSITTTLRIHANEMTSLRKHAEACNLAWSDLVMAAYGVWLRKLGIAPAEPESCRGSRDAEILLAMPMMARTSGILRRTPAMLVNMLPVRFTVRGEATMKDTAAAAHAALNAVRSHQRYPGSELARDLKESGGPAVLHGIGLNLKAFDFSLDFWTANGETTGVLRNIAGGPPEDLVLVATPTVDGELDLSFETDPTSVNASTARQRLNDIRALLLNDQTLPQGNTHTATPYGAELSGRPDTVQNIRLRSAHWRTNITTQRAGAPHPMTVPTLDALIDSLGDHPHPLLVSDDAAYELTATQILQRIDKLAAAITAFTPPASVLALDLPKGPDLAIAILGVWRSHRAFVVLDHEHPEVRRAHILADSRAVAIVDGSGVHPTDHSELPSLHTEDLAYLLYTSGTTGNPKGVEVTRSAVETLLAGHSDELWPDVWSRSTHGRLHVAHTASFSFDAALDQLAWIFTGATVHLYSAETIGDPELMHTALDRDQIHVLDATPSLVGALSDFASLNLTDSFISTIILGGEAVPPSLWNNLADAATASAGRFSAWNIYGPTEATVDALAARITPGPVTIGRAVAGMTAEILDVDGEPLPDNEVGELYLSGPQVARGYRNQIEHTVAAFDISPTGQRRYRTGDLVRWIPGRGTEFRGRADDQVEIRGHRVELAEVEAALLILPEVSMAAVGVFGAAGALKLIAHVTLSEAAAATSPTPDIRTALAAKVPGHLVPTRVQVHQKLPLTVGGKVDRQALAASTTLPTDDNDPSRERSAPVSSADGSTFPTEPRTEAEQVLSTVVREVLGELPSLNLDFISLGGDSIDALTAAGRLRQRGYALQAKELLSGQEIGDIASTMHRISPTAVPLGSGSSGGSGRDSVGPTDVGGTISSTGVFPVQPCPTDGAFIGTLSFSTLAGTQDGHTTLRTAVSAMMSTHGALRALLDHTDHTAPTGPRIIIPRTPVVSPNAIIAPAHSTDADLLVSLSPQKGVVWRITEPTSTGVLRVCVHRSVLDPDGIETFLTELRRALAGIPLHPPHQSWREIALGTPSNGTTPAQIQQRQPNLATESLPIPLPDITALFSLLPQLFKVNPSTVLLAVAALATGQPVGLYRHCPNGIGVIGDLSQTTTITAFSGNPREVLLHVKEALAKDFLPREIPADLRPYLTVSVVSSELTPTGSFLLPANAPHLTVTESGDAILYRSSPDLAQQITRAAISLAVLARSNEGGASPSDFQQDLLQSQITQNQIDTWEHACGPLKNVLPVSPLQEELLYHAATGGDGYILAAGIDLHGEVDPHRLHRAFHSVLDRHDLLRAQFDTSSLEEPVQIIPRRVELPWRTIDFSYLPEDAAFAAADHRLADMAMRHVDLRHDIHDPLVMAELILFPPNSSTTGADPLRSTARLILGNHHLLTDGWSTPVMLRDLLAFYHGEPLPDCAPFSAYLAWLSERNAADTTDTDAAAWHADLQGLNHGTLIRELAPATPDDVARSGTVSHETITELTVPASFTDQARHIGATPNTLLQAAWALTLAALTGTDDIVFGTPVSGRPTHVPGIENTVGLFINTLPVRVRLDPDSTLGSLVRTLGQRQAQMMSHHSTPLHRIEQLADVGPLFDTLVVVDNFPTLSAGSTPQVTEGRISLGTVHVDGMTNFPISIVSPPSNLGEPLRVVLAHRPDRVNAAFIDRTRTTLNSILNKLSTDDESTVRELLAGFAQWEPRPTTAYVSNTASPSTPAVPEVNSLPISVTIARTMASLLNIDQVDDHEDFFAIGGHSLLAMRLLSRLRHAGLKTISIQDIIESRTPAALAASLGTDAPRQILPLCTGTARPLFAVHPGGGFAFAFRGLADRLSAHNIPVVGLQLPDPLPEVASLTELAALYVDSLIRVQAHGPYRILGYSFGGAVAHAMTAEIIRRGESVEWLGIMDAYPAGDGPHHPAPSQPDDLAEHHDLFTSADADITTDILRRNLTFCDGLLRTCSPVDLIGFTGVLQLFIATRATVGTRNLDSQPNGWNPVPAWTSNMARASAETATPLTLNLTHEELITDAGWDAIAPTILERLP